MKLLHLGDLHIGRTLGEFNLADDQRYILRQALDLAQANGAEGILAAGDIYDRHDPGEEAVAIFNDFINDVRARGLKGFFISGNHDSEERLNLGSGFFRECGLYVESKCAPVLKKVRLQDEFGPCSVYLMPFVKASQVRCLYPEEEIRSYTDAVRVLIAHSDIDTAERNVLVAHQFVAEGKNNPFTVESEGPSVRTVGTVEIIDRHVFDCFDYVALGHIHTPQAVGREEVRYAGSPLKYSRSEAGTPKAAVLVTLGPKGNVAVEELPLKPLHEVRELRGMLKDLLDNACDTEDYIYATLLNPTPEPDAMRVLQTRYPRTVNLSYAALEHAGPGPAGRAADTGKPFGEMFSDFYQMIYGTEITGEELALIQSLAEKEGIVHGAD